MLSLDAALLSIALGIDAALVAFAIGLAHPDKSHAPGLRLAVWFGGFQLLMSLIGFQLTSHVSFLRHGAEKGAGIVFILLGAKLVWDAWHESEEASIPTTHHAHLLLAVATSLDALAAGVGLVRSNHAMMTIVLIGLVAFLMTWIGARLSRVVSHLPEKYLALAGGGILFFLGAKTFI
jgi:putative Mn2+ efflux pump MntP